MTRRCDAANRLAAEPDTSPRALTGSCPVTCKGQVTKDVLFDLFQKVHADMHKNYLAKYIQKPNGD